MAAELEAGKQRCAAHSHADYLQQMVCGYLSMPKALVAPMALRALCIASGEGGVGADMLDAELAAGICRRGCRLRGLCKGRLSSGRL